MQQEKLIVEEKYGNLQEEAAGKTKKLQKINQMYKSAKAEVLFLKFLIGILYFFRFIKNVPKMEKQLEVVTDLKEKIGNTSKLYHFVDITIYFANIVTPCSDNRYETRA